MYLKKFVSPAVKCLLLVLLCALACSKGSDEPTPEPPPPTPFTVQISTTEISSVTATSARTGGSITVTGNGSVKSKGIVWNTSSAPTTAHNKTEAGTGADNFSASLSGLTSGTTYYVRSYAIDDKNTVHYGNEVSFTTQYNVQVTTSPLTVKSGTSAEFTGTITVTGAEKLKSRGFCYGPNPLPTVAGTKVSVEGTTGDFKSTVTTLTAGATYYVRAFAVAHNDVIFYGNDVSFSTPGAPTTQEPPAGGAGVTVTTTQATSVTAAAAKVGGTVSTNVLKVIGAKGICWATTSNPTTSNSKTMLGGGEGSFQSDLTGLQPNTRYYARAWAWDESQTVTYGNEISFTTTGTGGSGGSGGGTTENKLTVTTTALKDISANTATSGGTVTISGLATVTSRGVCWGTFPNTNINHNRTTNGSGSGSFESSLTNLAPNMKYYVRAYAIDGSGTVVYGNELSFTTTISAESKISITTGAVTNITSHSATGSATIAVQGSETVVERGIAWSSGINPQKGSSYYCTSGSGPGTFQCAFSGMPRKTKMYARAFVVLGDGRQLYGNEVTFTTADAPPANPANFSLITHVPEISLGTHSAGNQPVMNVNVAAEVTNLTRVESIQDYGIVYGFSSGQTISSNIRMPARNVTEPHSKETFQLVNFAPGTTVYIRSYLVTKEQNIYYGNEVTAYTANSSFAVSTWLSPYIKTTHTLNLTGLVQNSTTEKYTAIGFVYAKHSNPTLSDYTVGAASVKPVVAPTGDEFTTPLGTLAYSTTYYYRAYAKTDKGRTVYGNVANVTTMAAPSTGGGDTGGGGSGGGDTGGGGTGGGTASGSRNNCLTITSKGQINQCTNGAFSVTVANTNCTDKIDIRIILRKKNGQIDAGLRYGVEKGGSTTYWTCDGTGEFQIQSRTAGSNTPFPEPSGSWQK
ncbi:MAG TPA: hypothetical protein VGE15_03035 [Sphingobacteriaceae bacterium]